MGSGSGRPPAQVPLPAGRSSLGPWVRASTPHWAGKGQAARQLSPDKSPGSGSAGDPPPAWGSLGKLCPAEGQEELGWAGTSHSSSACENPIPTVLITPRAQAVLSVEGLSPSLPSDTLEPQVPA